MKVVGARLTQLFFLTAVFLIFTIFFTFAWASKKDCKQGNKPAEKIPFSKEVKEDTRRGVIYLAFVGGDTPKPNACGLKPKNPENEWTGWGGPIDSDNMTIGEGPGTRNDIVIGGTLFERGIGMHAQAKLLYDLTGDNYVHFSAYAGIADDPGSEADAGCPKRGSTIFVFSVDGKEVYKTPLLVGMDGGKNFPPHKVEFDIPEGSKELLIDIQDGGDGKGCDHSTLGDAKLLTPKAMAIERGGKIAISWGKIKAAY